MNRFTPEYEEKIKKAFKHFADREINAFTDSANRFYIVVNGLSYELSEHEVGFRAYTVDNEIGI